MLQSGTRVKISNPFDMHDKRFKDFRGTFLRYTHGSQQFALVELDDVQLEGKLKFDAKDLVWVYREAIEPENGHVLP